MAADSPITIRLRTEKDKRTATLVEIESNESGQLLAHCQIGDDANMERIADILSAKRLPREAEAIRRIMMEARRGPRR